MKKKTPDREYDSDGSYLSLSLRICAPPRARASISVVYFSSFCYCSVLRASISVVYFSSFCYCSVLRAWPRALAPGASSSRTYPERRKETLILRTFQPTILFSYLPVLRNRCRWIPTYLPTGPSFQHQTFPLAIKEKRSAQSERKRALFFDFFFSFFCNSATIVRKWVPFLPLGKRKESKRKEKKNNFVQNQSLYFTLFLSFFLTFFFLLYSFTSKGPLKKIFLLICFSFMKI
jgi:hypothetical protein